MTSPPAVVSFVILCKPSPFLRRHLGLDLVPRKEFEMVDPDQISISELYKLVSGVEFFFKVLRTVALCELVTPTCQF